MRKTITLLFLFGLSNICLAQNTKYAQDNCEVLSPWPKMTSVLHVDKCKIIKNNQLHSGMVTLFNYFKVKSDNDPVPGTLIIATANCNEGTLRIEGYLMSQDIFAQNATGRGITGIDSSTFKSIKDGTLGEKTWRMLCEN